MMKEELKLCPQCHTMKAFSTNICFRCLDRNEAREEVNKELVAKLEGMKEKEIDNLWALYREFCNRANQANMEKRTLFSP